MRWTPGGESGNIEDRRGESGGGGFSLGRGGLGIGGFLVLLVLSFIFKTNFFALVGRGGTDTAPPAASSAPVRETPDEQREVQFVSFVLDDVQSTWAKIFQQEGMNYTPAKLVLFRNAIRSGCGSAQTAMGPFYCPLDHKAYIDLAFYDELRSRFGAQGDFAQAYVLAHELGHHVQSLLGIDEKVRRLQSANPDQANALSVRLELQADCFAGVWANTTARRDLLDPGDLEEALNAAAAVGDDRLQRATQGTVNPDAFTHGTAQQRASWFKRGYDGGKIASCDTFGANG